MDGQDGWEQNKQSDLEVSKAVRGRFSLPALIRPGFWSNTPLSTGLVGPKTCIWKSHSQLCLPFHEIRLSQAFPFISHDISRIAKSKKMFTPTYYFFFFLLLCVFKFMEMLRENFVYLKLNKSLPRPVFKPICALKLSSYNFVFRDETNPWQGDWT